MHKLLIKLWSLTVLLLSYSVINLCAQAPGIEWQNTIGGTKEDYGRSIEQTNDGGYIVGGSSYSYLNGDKTEPYIGLLGFEDYWVLKLDHNGLIEWQNTIGGNEADDLKVVKQTFDGGYIVAGESDSGIEGDKTENNIGQTDIWIVKLNSEGIILWQKTIGGIYWERLGSCEQTLDGGFILGCTSSSIISGNKTEERIGEDDYWIVKLDIDGNIEWQNTIGGFEDDILESVKQTSDGGYILGGYSNSDISGDKTENAIITGATHYYDYWLIKLDVLGNIEWQNTIGGTKDDFLFEVQEVLGVGFILAGYSISLISGDKTENGSNYDYWVIQTNYAGEIIWQNTLIGDYVDRLTRIEITPDGGFLLGGKSDSNAGGYDKVAPKFGFSDYWVIKIDSSGIILWQQVFGTTSTDSFNDIALTYDGGYVVCGYSSGGISGTKTEANLGLNDYYIIKLDGPPCTPSPELCNSLDDNCNGLIDDAITETISISAGGPTTFCQGGNVLLTATYSGATVQWKKNGTNIPGATSPTYLVTTKGTYTCETTSVCDTELSTGIFVNVQKNPPAAITAGGPTTFCAGGSVILTANAGGGLSYQWYKGASLIAGATSINYTATIAGNYKCRVTKTATGCFKNSNVINVSVPCKEGVLTTNEKTITIAPNPNNGTFMLDVLFIEPKELNPETATVEIYNPLSQLIFTQQLPVLDNAIHENISINNLAAGIYQVKIIFAENSYTQQLLIHN